MQRLSYKTFSFSRFVFQREFLNRNLLIQQKQAGRFG